MEGTAKAGNGIPQRKCAVQIFFFGRRPLPFGGSPLEAYPWTSGEKMCSAEVRRKPIGTNGVQDEALQREPRVNVKEDSKSLQQGDPLKPFEISSVAAADVEDSLQVELRWQRLRLHGSGDGG